MSGHESYPPPGAQQPPPPGPAAYPPPAAGHGAPALPPTHQAYGAPQPPPFPGHQPYPQPFPGHQPQQLLLGAAHKPGAIPLRPLGLGDLYDGAFKVIRYNPKATVGSAVVVAAVAMLLPLLVTAVLTWAVDLSVPASGSADPADGDLIGLGASMGSLVLGFLLQGLGLLLVAGMVTHVVAAAAVGRRLGMGEAWAATRGRRWRLLGLSFLLMTATMLLVGLYVLAWVLAVSLTEGAVPLVVFGLVTVPLFLALLCWFWIRVYYLPVPALMLEQVGIFRAIGRGFQLTRRQFCRTFGIALLTTLVVQIAAGMLTTPISLLGQGLLLTVGPQYQLLGLVVVQAVSTVLAASFVTPFTTAVTALQYVDQRMRKEAFDVELMSRAGITGS